MRRKDDEKQNKIKQAVIKLILEQGFHGTSIAKIAREAGVSPATVYIYYENKDDMLREIYEEYTEQVYSYILRQLGEEMNGKKIIETIIRAYHKYIMENEEAFHFIEQFSSCPALANNCHDMEGCSRIFSLFEELKEQNIIKDINNAIIFSMLFYPVKCIAVQFDEQQEEVDKVLAQLIEVMQGALLLV